jgi:large subunit ribosomal protein L10
MGEKTQKIQPHKTEAIARIRSLVEGSRDLVFTDYRGLTVEQITALRRSLREQQVEYRVVKNNYARLALGQMGVPLEEAFLVDPTALALVRSDIAAAAKVLLDFTRDTTLRIKGGLVEGRVVSAAEVEAISRLPGRQELYAILLGTMNAPLTNLMYVMNGVASKLVRALQAVAEKKAES